MTLEEIVNSLKSAGQDYGQLFNNNPKYNAVASNVTKGLENLVPPQFTNTQDAKSQEYSKKLAEWALGNGMGMSGMALAVSGYGGAKNIGDILNKKYGENIEADISGNNKGLTLNKIIVDKEKRNQGLGSSFLKDLTKYADLNKQPISLTAGGDFGGNKARQINLYKKFGFLENKGKNKDYSISENMYRNPIESNLNADLLKKYLSTGKLSPKEMAQYEANGLVMETPQLQRYNVANAMVNPERQAYIDTLNVPVYHGTNEDIPAMSVEGKGKTRGAGAFVGTNPIASETYVQAFQGGNILPLLLNDKGFLKVNGKGQYWNDISTDSLYHKKTPLTDILPLEKNDFTSTDELGSLAKDAEYKGITIKNLDDLGLNSHIFRAKEYLNNKYGIVPDETWSNVPENKFNEARNFMENQYKKQRSDVTAVNDPSLLRSRFAAFDPLRKNSSSLLASGLLGALLFNNENKTSENR